MDESFKPIHDKVGDRKFWNWMSTHGYDENVPITEQKSVKGCDTTTSLLDLFGEETPNPTVEEKPIVDDMNRRESMKDGGGGKTADSDNTPDFIGIQSYNLQYSAAPKFDGPDAPIIIKAIVLEEGANVNGWRVDLPEFERVASQYKEGRQLRVNHGSNVGDVIGKSFDGKVVKGSDLEVYMGMAPEGIINGQDYVVAEFEANPQDLQVR